MEVDVVVLADLEEAVGIANPDEHREIPRERVEVHVVANASGERFVGGRRDELTELDEARFLGVGQIGFGIVRLVVGRPGRAHRREGRAGGRLQDGALSRVEPVLDEVLVDVLRDRVQAEIAPLPSAGHGQIHLGVGGPWCMRAGIAVEPIGQDLVHPADVGDVVLEVEGRHAGELLALDVLVEVDLQRDLARRRARADTSRCPCSAPRPRERCGQRCRARQARRSNSMPCRAATPLRPPSGPTMLPPPKPPPPNPPRGCIVCQSASVTVRCAVQTRSCWKNASGVSGAASCDGPAGSVSRSPQARMSSRMARVP